MDFLTTQGWSIHEMALAPTKGSMSSDNPQLSLCQQSYHNGVLLGFDLLRHPAIRRMGVPVASIGGA
jgi:uncharacterized membrane protein